MGLELFGRDMRESSSGELFVVIIENFPFFFCRVGDRTWDVTRLRVYFWVRDFFLGWIVDWLMFSGTRLVKLWSFLAVGLCLLQELNFFSLLLGIFVPIEVILLLMKPPRVDFKASISLISCCIFTVWNCWFFSYCRILSLSFWAEPLLRDFLRSEPCIRVYRALLEASFWDDIL